MAIKPRQRYGFFLYEMKQKSILFVFQPKINWNIIRNPYNFPILHSRLPFRHGFHNTNRFFITATANSPQYSNIGNTSVWFNDEIDKHSTFYPLFFCIGRIFSIVGNELKKALITSRKLWHLFDNHINPWAVFILNSLIKVWLNKPFCIPFL